MVIKSLVDFLNMNFPDTYDQEDHMYDNDSINYTTESSKKNLSRMSPYCCKANIS